jgi:hypothetical protein
MEKVRASEMCIREIELDSVPQKTIRVRQQLCSDVGGVVWDAALALVKFFDYQQLQLRSQCKGDASLAPNESYSVEGKTVVELGSGTGCVGLALAALGSVQCIEYRCEDGRLQVSKSFLTISNPDSLLNSGTGVNP